jgi:hypothetical protein
MVDDGYQDIVNIDISSVVIDQMKKKYRDKPHLKCILFVPSLFLLNPLVSVIVYLVMWYYLFPTLHRHEDGCKEHG